MDDETATIAGEAYAEGYRQCLEDVMREGVDAARRIAEDEGLPRLMAEAYAEGSPSSETV